MKLINNLPNIFEKEQVKGLENFILKKADLRHIVWENILEDVLIDIDNFTLNKLELFNENNVDVLENQLEKVFINLVALMQENAIIRDTISKHELIRKDDVQGLTDINSKKISILAISDKEQYSKNVTIKNNILTLIPGKINYYQPSKINIVYYPDSLDYIIGNIPDKDKVSSGTFSGYWFADIYTGRKTDVGAVITFEYESNINFNNINLRGSSSYPLSIEMIRYYNNGWNDITPSNLGYNKDFYIVFNQFYSGNKIEITLKQKHYDYIMQKEVNDAYVLRDMVIQGKDITAFKNTRIDEYLESGKIELVNRYTLRDKYKYEIGCYNIQVFSKKYIDDDGIFNTKSFTIDEIINNVELITVDNSLGNITYSLIQDDKSYVEFNSITNLPVNVSIPVTKLFEEVEMRTDLTGNKIPLPHYPYKDDTHDIEVKINGEEVIYKEKFEFTDDLEFVVSDNNIYINKELKNTIVYVQYWRKTSLLVLEVILNTGVSGYSSVSPEVSSLNLKINGELQ